MRALDMGRLQFNPFTADVGPVIAPIELEGFIGFEHQKHLGAASRRLLGRVPICAPSTPKGCDTLVGPIVAQLTRSSCSSLTLRRSLRDFRVWAKSHADKQSAQRSSLL